MAAGRFPRRNRCWGRETAKSPRKTKQPPWRKLGTPFLSDIFVSHMQNGKTHSAETARTKPFRGANRFVLQRTHLTVVRNAQPKNAQQGRGYLTAPTSVPAREPARGHAPEQKTNSLPLSSLEKTPNHHRSPTKGRGKSTFQSPAIAFSTFA